MSSICASGSSEMEKITHFKKQNPTAITEFVGNGGEVTLEFNDALDCYRLWPAPTAIVVDGPYGLAKFPGDPPFTDQLPAWYEPHIRLWSELATPATTLWFWCTELGWAEVHPVLKAYGWKYRAAYVWNKGVGHVAGNCNGETIRSFPVVTEVCVQYVKEARLEDADGNPVPLKVWLRREWRRSGLPLNQTNDACGVRNAATRKYFTQCHLWYFPPPEKMIQLAEYATAHGAPTDRPYFSLDGRTPLTREAWAAMRAKWNHTHGVTNVWDEPAVRGVERLKSKSSKCLHANQKPLKLIERIILASTDPGDVIWEPFGGLCSGLVAALRNGRRGYGAEINPEYFRIATGRLREVVRQGELFGASETA